MIAPPSSTSSMSSLSSQQAMASTSSPSQQQQQRRSSSRSTSQRITRSSVNNDDESSSHSLGLPTPPTTKASHAMRCDEGDFDDDDESVPQSSRRTATRSSSTTMWSHMTMLLVALLLLSWSPTMVRADNTTSLTGTWSSGAGHVTTGLGFFNPITKNFTIPASGGIAYSFIDDMPGGGHFETSTFSFTSNPSSNRCFNATLTWQHGTYTVNANGSLSLTPYEPDGVVQVMDPCGATSIAQYSYSEFELIPYWYNYIEADTGFGTLGQANTAYAMGLYSNNGTGGLGARKNIMNLVSRPPTMLPTEQLHEEILNSVSA